MYKSQNRNLGIFLAVLGASLWGLGGTISDYLFSIKNIQINWFMTSRLLISGSFLLIIHKILYNQTDIFKIWKSISTIIPLIIFSILGMLLVQYSFMASINYGNASVATMLQYIAPIYVILCFSLRDKIKLSLFDFITIFLTLIGMFLLLTNGSFQVLMVPSPSLIWGIISGLSLAFYTIYVNRLLINFNSLLIVGWSMIISGLIMNFIHPIWGIKPDDLSVITIMALLFSIFAGTALAFWFFIKSLEYLSSKETTLFGTVEPIVAIISSFLLLNVTFYKWQFIGIIIILFLITLISLKKPT